MTASGSHFEGAAYTFLTADVSEVQVELVLLFVEDFAGVDFGWCRDGFAHEGG